MELKIGPYREVYEAHQKSFISIGHSKTDADAIAQAIVSRPLPESALSLRVDYFETILPKVFGLLEFNHYEQVAMQVQSALLGNRSVQSEAGISYLNTVLVNGVYPGFVTFSIQETGVTYVADWSMTESGDVSFSNVRNITTGYNQFIRGYTQELLPGLDLAQYSATLPFEVESEYMSAQFMEESFPVPSAKLDGLRPVDEMEFLKFLRRSKAIAETTQSPMVFEARSVRSPMNVGEIASRICSSLNRLAEIEKQAVEARVALQRPLQGRPMFEKSTTIQTVVIDKKKYSKSEASAMAKRNGWSGDSQDSDSSYRFRQHDPDACESGSFRTISLKDGVSAVVCKLKSGSKNEQWLDLTEAGDYRSLGGHDIHLDSDDAQKGDLSSAEKQIQAHNRFGDKLNKSGFTKSPWDTGRFTKPLGNGYDTTVKLAGGKAHVAVTRHGEVRDLVGTATSGPELDGHVDAAEAKSKRMPKISGFEAVAAGAR